MKLVLWTIIGAVLVGIAAWAISDMVKAING